MSRKDFELIAAIVKELADRNGSTVTIKDIAKAFARGLEHTNPNFNQVRFLHACGLETWSL